MNRYSASCWSIDSFAVYYLLSMVGALAQKMHTFFYVSCNMLVQADACTGCMLELYLLPVGVVSLRPGLLGLGISSNLSMCVRGVSFKVQSSKFIE